MPHKKKIKYSKSLRDKAMRIICDFHKHKEINTLISSKYLYYHGIPKTIDAIHLLTVLQSLGYIQLKRHANEPDYYIHLTDSGRCYFEVSSDNRREFWKRSVMMPIIVSIVTNLVISGIRQLLPLILQLLSSTP